MRTPGVEPGSQAWKACMMPLHYVRLPLLNLRQLKHAKTTHTHTNTSGQFSKRLAADKRCHCETRAHNTNLTRPAGNAIGCCLCFNLRLQHLKILLLRRRRHHLPAGWLKRSDSRGAPQRLKQTHDVYNKTTTQDRGHTHAHHSVPFITH